MIEPTNWWRAKLVVFIATHTPKCHDITRLISESLDRPLPLATRIKMWVHCRICAWCERYRDQLGFLRHAVHSCPERKTPALSSEARTRLKTAVMPRPWSAPGGRESRHPRECV